MYSLLKSCYLHSVAQLQDHLYCSQPIFTSKRTLASGTTRKSAIYSESYILVCSKMYQTRSGALSRARRRVRADRRPGRGALLRLQHAPRPSRVIAQNEFRPPETHQPSPPGSPTPHNAVAYVPRYQGRLPHSQHRARAGQDWRGLPSPLGAKA